jgi:hypothetical protein
VLSPLLHLPREPVSTWIIYTGFSKLSFTDVPDPKALKPDDLHMLHRIFTKNSDKVLALFHDKESGQAFSKLLAQIGSYQSKISLSFLGNHDQSKF